MPEALTAWLSTPDRWIGLNYQPGSLEIGQNAQGGYTDATLRLQESINSKDPILGPMTRLVVTDATTARVAWEGYLDIPGREKGDGGDVWDIGAVGPSARLFDRKLPYIVIDTDLSGWRQLFATNSAMTAQVTGLPTDETVDCLLLTFPQGIPVGTGARVTASYGALRRAGQLLGGYSSTHREGFTAANDWKYQTLPSLSGVDQIADNVLYDTTERTHNRSAGGVAFTVGPDQLKVRIIRETGGATNVNSDTNWSGITRMRVSALRHDIEGNQITGANTYADDFVLAHQVIIDALWHFPTAIDPAIAEIDMTFTHHIDQMAYFDPVTFQQVLEDLALLEPDMLWEVLHSGPNGHLFRVRRLSDDVRYLADARDGWSSPGAESDLRNAVTVAWTDKAERSFSDTYTTDVPSLDQWGITRDADLVELGEEVGSQANADRIGPAVLEATNAAPAAGTLTVTQPVHDTWTGQDVMPWEIQPGYRIDIADVDGDPIPITERSYQAGVATLTLGEPVLTTEQIVNQLARRRRNR